MTQRIIPPPKYMVDRLVDCTIIRSTQVENLFVIERGEPSLCEIDPESALETLVVNTDDAYGFPPFREMAPSIVIGQDDYAELRRKEEIDPGLRDDGSPGPRHRLGRLLLGRPDRDCCSVRARSASSAAEVTTVRLRPTRRWHDRDGALTGCPR